MSRFESLEKAGMKLSGYHAIGYRVYAFVDYLGQRQLIALGELAKSEPSLSLFSGDSGRLVIGINAKS